MSQIADLLLAQSSFTEWSGDAVLLSGRLARAKVSLVVQIYAVGDGIEAPASAEFLHYGEQLILAVETAGRVIANIFRPVQFIGDDDFERDSVFAGESGGVSQLGASQARRIGNDSQHIVAQDFMRCPGEKSRVRAAGIGDQGSSQGAQVPVKQNAFADE